VMKGRMMVLVMLALLALSSLAMVACQIED
jgi:hypothetical protein